MSKDKPSDCHVDGGFDALMASASSVDNARRHDMTMIAFADGPPTLGMTGKRDKAMARLTPESEGRWGKCARGRRSLAEGAWESGWDAALRAMRLEGDTT